MLSIAEENYLKAIYKIVQHQGVTCVSTNTLAQEMGTRAASVTDMVQRLADKSLLTYQKYRGVVLTREGQHLAILLLRKHRLWESFLVDKLGFRWDQVHELAEQLEHIQSEELIERLDAYLDYPRFDPHGDPIPNEQGNFFLRQQVALSVVETKGKSMRVLAVRQHRPEFLRYLDSLHLKPGCMLELLEKNAFDLSMEVLINGSRRQWITHETAQDIFVKPIVHEIHTESLS